MRQMHSDMEAIHTVYSLRSIAAFQRHVRDFYRREGRDLPWRHTTDPYCILVSEIMLQQTQADRVIPKYHTFIETFPTVAVLARASLGDVLRQWQGLGYNRRGKALREAAQKMVVEHGAQVPCDRVALESLPGVGPYTAGAVRAFAFNEPEVFIETNIRTVFLHHFFPKESQVSDQELLSLIEKSCDQKNPREWYSALMDYGAMLKKTVGNSSRRSRHYSKQSVFMGSHRQLRGAIVRALATEEALSSQMLTHRVNGEKERVQHALKQLLDEGMLVKQGRKFTLA